MRKIYEAVELTNYEKLLLFYLLSPALKCHLKERGVFVQDVYMIVSALGEERLEEICVDLNETIFDTEAIKNLSDRVR